MLITVDDIGDLKCLVLLDQKSKKNQNIQFTVIHDKEKQQIFSFEMLESEYLSLFHYFYFDRLFMNDDHFSFCQIIYIFFKYCCCMLLYALCCVALNRQLKE